MELKFHKGTSIFYDENGKLREEPEESLEELLGTYDSACEQYLEFRRRQKDAESPYRKPRWIGNNRPRFIEDRSFNYGHRTWENAGWSDITLAFAADFSSPGEITTKKAAGDKLIPVTLPKDIKAFRTGNFQEDRLKETVKALAEAISSNPHYRTDGIRLNIAGNGAGALRRCGITDLADVDYFIYRVLYHLTRSYGIKVKEVRSGGQTGADEAGIKAAQGLGLPCSILAPKGFRMRDADGVDHEGREGFEARFKETYVDYEEWERKNPTEYMSYGLGEFNGFNGIDMLEYDIDLKIMHINERQGMDGK